MSDLPIITGENLSGITILMTGHYVGCNISQPTPETAIEAHGCVFDQCSLVNCRIPADNEIIDCNTSQSEPLTEPLPLSSQCHDTGCKGQPHIVNYDADGNWITITDLDGNILETNEGE